MFTDFDEFADPMRLTISGKTYEIPPIGGEDGLRLTALLASETKLADEELRRLLLGDVGPVILKECTFATYSRVLMTALCEFQYGRAIAEDMWATGGDPKALKELRVTREGEDSTTAPQASGNGTRKRKSPAPRSGGRTSSTSGS